ncbi:MAG: septum formation protein Maf [Paludibacteraceae bacterium]|nr:septum formation protein Maf [Paludibacteraceae bacterium]
MLILGSQSPRRQELLKGLDIPFEVKTIDGIEEVFPPHLKREEIPLYLSQLKANAYLDLIDKDTIVITADTIVWCEDQLLEKPKDKTQAKQMLRFLSGKTHSVYTGVTLLSKQKSKSFFAESKVTFSDLSDEEINYYVEKYNPIDKAGAYGVQEWIGYIAVKKIEGSYYNVMGLPIQLLYNELKTF